MSCVAAHAGGVQLPESPSPRDILSINRYIRGVLEIENRESFHRTVPKLGEPVPPDMRVPIGQRRGLGYVVTPCLIGPKGS